MSEKRMALGAGVNALFTTSVSNFGALCAESLPTTRLSTYVPSLAALNVGCAVLASVSVAGERAVRDRHDRPGVGVREKAVGAR